MDRIPKAASSYLVSPVMNVCDVDKIKNHYLQVPMKVNTTGICE